MLKYAFANILDSNFRPDLNILLLLFLLLNEGEGGKRRWQGHEKHAFFFKPKMEMGLSGSPNECDQKVLEVSPMFPCLSALAELLIHPKSLLPTFLKGVCFEQM